MTSLGGRKTLTFAVGPGSLSFLIHHSSSFPQRINWFEKKTDEWERMSLAFFILFLTPLPYAGFFFLGASGKW